MADDLPELEVWCDNCDDRGMTPAYEKCERCGGTGYTLTEAGEKVLRLIRHRFLSLLRDSIKEDRLGD